MGGERGQDKKSLTPDGAGEAVAARSALLSGRKRRTSSRFTTHSWFVRATAVQYSTVQYFKVR